MSDWKTKAYEISGLRTPLYDREAANKKYVDDNASAGGTSPTSWTTPTAVSGIQLAGIGAMSGALSVGIVDYIASANALANFYPSTLGNGVSGNVKILNDWYIASGEKLSTISGSLSTRINTKQDTLTGSEYYPSSLGKQVSGAVLANTLHSANSALHSFNVANYITSTNSITRFADSSNYSSHNHPLSGLSDVEGGFNPDNYHDSGLKWNKATGLWVATQVAGGGGAVDNYTVKIDTGATADFIGAANSDGVLRTGDTMTYADGGNYITIGVDQGAILTTVSSNASDGSAFSSNAYTEAEVNAISSSIVTHIDNNCYTQTWIDTYSGNVDTRIDALGGFSEEDYITSSNSITRFADSSNYSTHKGTNNAHHALVTVAGAPLTLSTQEVTFNYDSNQFGLNGNDIQLLGYNTISSNTLHSGTTHDYAFISSKDGATNVTAAELETLSDGSDADALHTHPTFAGAPTSWTAPTAGLGISITGDGKISGAATFVVDDYIASANVIAGFVESGGTKWVDLTDGGETSLHSHAGGADTPANWGTLTEGTGIASITSVGISGSGDHDVTVLGYDTISSQAKKGYLSGQRVIETYTTAEQTKIGHLAVTQAVNLDTVESDTATNTGKVTCDTTNVNQSLGGQLISSNAKTAYTHSQVAGGNSVHVSTTENTHWDTGYTHSQIAGGNSVHVSTTENTNWDTAYTHSQDNTQAHSDYLLNSGDDSTTGTLTAKSFVGPISSTAISGAWTTPLYHTRPAAAIGNCGRIVRVSGASNEKTYVYMSVKNDANTYEWIQMGVST